MSKITLKGNAIDTNGALPEAGAKAPDFELVKSDLTPLALSSLKGKRVILNIFPSLDTSVCATSVRKFNKEAAGLQNTVVLAISKDLPFASARFCTAEGIENVIPLSAFRDNIFDYAYGMLIVNGPLAGLLARGVVVIGEDGKILHSQLVPEITQEPDYEAALAVLK